MIDGQEGKTFANRNSLEERLKECKGLKTLENIDKNAGTKLFEQDSWTRDKGIAGKVVELSVLNLPGYDPSHNPDITVGNVNYEVKTTGIKKDRQGEDCAKEPVSITAVSPEDIINQEYRGSTFFKKIEHLLFFYYRYDYSKRISNGTDNSKSTAADYRKFELLDYQFHEHDEFSEIDRKRLQDDWTAVRDFAKRIRENYSEKELSEKPYKEISDELRALNLTLLDTAPRWTNNPRFRFKRTFVSAIYSERGKNAQKAFDTLENPPECIQDIIDKCTELVKNYSGKTLRQLNDCSELNLHLTENSKSVAEAVIVKMFGGKSCHMSKIELFCKAGIIGKSIVLTRGGKRTEDVKFFDIDFDEITNGPQIDYRSDKANSADIVDEFEESQFYEYFWNHKILFAVFEEPNQNASLLENKFIGFALLTFDEDFLKEVKTTWEMIRDLVRNNKLEEKNIDL